MIVYNVACAAACYCHATSVPVQEQNNFRLQCAVRGLVQVAAVAVAVVGLRQLQYRAVCLLVITVSGCLPVQHTCLV
jgi:hypothetical protein